MPKLMHYWLMQKKKKKINEMWVKHNQLFEGAKKDFSDYKTDI